MPLLALLLIGDRDQWTLLKFIDLVLSTKFSTTAVVLVLVLVVEVGINKMGPCSFRIFLL